MHYNYIIENYTGVTNNLYHRKRSHKCKSNRDVENMQVIKAFVHREDALKYERHLQDNCGYLGRLKGTSQKRGSNGRSVSVIDTETNQKFDCLRTACDELGLNINTEKYRRSKGYSRLKNDG